ncbi:MAG: acyl-CoA thioesterase [Planctomycetes bacterium]|nr:acyl-CoA thioesterase [Planctomycetota bacterium]
MSADPAPPVLTESIPVRWGDMDALGHVNNCAFFTYCESARMAYFRSLELERFADATRGVVLATASCAFKQQVRYPATLAVEVRVGRIGRSSFTLHYDLLDKESGESVATGESVVVWASYTGGGSIPLPDELRAALGGSSES